MCCQNQRQHRSRHHHYENHQVPKYQQYLQNPDYLQQLNQQHYQQLT